MSIFNANAPSAGGGAEIETGTFTGTGEISKTVTFTNTHTEAPSIAFMYCTTTPSSTAMVTDMLVRTEALDSSLYSGAGYKSYAYGRSGSLTSVCATQTSTNINSYMTSTGVTFTGFSFIFRSGYVYRWYAIWL